MLARAIAAVAASAEGHVIIGACGRQVDGDDPGTRVAAEMRRAGKAAGDDAGGQAEIGVVDDAQPLVIAADLDDRGERRLICMSFLEFTKTPGDMK